jgi:CW-type Zinc Finger/Protein SET DOMAIN GROUP 2 C-terminal/SET domain
MALERPQNDPRGYGLLLVDASRKAGHGSSLSHSCAPTCEVRVAACDGELCLAMTTLRELEMGEELTFDYNAVTESLNEYRSAVCLCGYGKCRGSFLHFATADCYQQVLNRNSPIASRFASLIKGSMKQVMSPDDEQIQRNHGFLTAAFGAISVNRRANTLTGIGEGLVDSLDMVPIWLRTYVADTLRYIEYERRALPIALICEHLSTSSKKDTAEDLVSEPLKERRPVSTFFYFLKTQADFLRDLMAKEGFPDSLSGLQFRHAMQKVAANFWSNLPEEKKKYWKEQAQNDFDKKTKEGLVVTKRQSTETQTDVKKKLSDSSMEGKRKSGEGKKVDKNKGKPEIHDILHSSKISFHEADAEGVVAMEQRIQQLTQTLSRVGRVLDRHREGIFESNPGRDTDAESMRKLVHAPVRVLTDAEVINWIWKQSDGLVLSLLREVECSRFVRPNLHRLLHNVCDEYSSIEALGDNDQSPNGRRLLKEALLKLRSVILQELKAMAKEFRQLRTQACIQQTDDHNTQNPAPFSDTDSEENIPPDREFLNVSEDVKKSAEASIEARESVETTDDVTGTKLDSAVEESNPWLEFYAERFVLHSASDLLLMYAHTSNFFVFQPYLPLESSPVEVYARELGNEVPRSVIDKGLSGGPEKSNVDARCESVEGLEVGSVTGSNPNVISNKTDIDTTVGSDLDKKKNEGDMCAPDDIVAEVTIKYDGDYVPSQLLQWYNAGIGQKPGLPDLLGCALLPNISDCWSSELRSMKKTKGDGKTKYETKIRPRLVEWMQDPYERGNPWPLEIKQAFVRDGDIDCRTSFSDSFGAFGSPIIDFLVMGDESNIIDVLYELDADDKIATKKSGDGLLTSVDKGRPAQAVSTWVQCENLNCMKWRKIPWFVDADLLPERFFCKDNQWNPSGNSCEAPEDDWDKDDAMVGSDGKVEGSPVNKKKFEGSLPVDEESSFRIGSA